MGIITGYICLLIMFILLLKFLTRKFQWKKADRILMKYHKYVAALFLASGTVHFILVLPVLFSRWIAVWVTGIFSVSAGLILVIFCHIIKDKKKSLVLHRLLSFLMLLAAVLHISFYWIDYNSYQMQISSISVQEVDCSGIPDGTYIGECDVGYIYARVRLSVKDGKIEKAELLEHRNEKGKAAEKILEDIVSEQNTDVDAVSGATNSSKVIKKACENALRGN